MSVSSRPWLLLLLLGALSCASPSLSDDDDDSSGDDDDTGDDDDDDTVDLPGPCEDESWGGFDAEVDAVWIAPEGTGTGTALNPLGSIEEGLAQARLRGAAVGLLDGEWELSLVLGAADDGLFIGGCGGGTVLTAPREIGPDGEDRGTPVFELAGVQGVVLSGLTLRGGRRAVLVHEGAGSETPIELRDLVIEQSERVAVLVDGASTRVTLEDVLIDGVTAEDDEFGYGVAIQGRLSPWSSAPPASSLTSVEIVDATGAGVLVDAGRLNLGATTVRDTRPWEGGAAAGVGRGVHMQRLGFGQLLGVELTGNTDAGLFLLEAGLVDAAGGSENRVEVIGSTIGSTLGGSGATGDGIVLVGAGSAPERHQLQLSGSTIEANARTGALVEDARLELLSGNSFIDNIFPSGDVFWIGGEVTGEGLADAVVTELESPLDLFPLPLPIDDLTD